uniref:Movement protein TGB2 n=1 Tax=Carya illinoinensis carlavirus 1 TaxID=2794420 RepID=A0A7T5QZF5_9VIRU|nr:TGB2 [Carya illinoinensis carlavirus 1]
MPLTPPPDYTKVLFAVAGGLGLALIIGLFTRSTLPFSGDQAHSLPHGGWYKDGTKQVYYGGPGKLNSVEKQGFLIGQPWAIVIILVGLIILSTLRSPNRCVICGHSH